MMRRLIIFLVVSQLQSPLFPHLSTPGVTSTASSTEYECPYCEDIFGEYEAPSDEVIARIEEEEEMESVRKVNRDPCCAIPVKSLPQRIQWHEGIHALKKFETDLTSPKHTLIVFSASKWCLWCQKLHSQFLTKPLLAEEISSLYDFILVEFPTHDEIESSPDYRPIIDKYKIKGFPTIIVFNRAHEEVMRWNFPQTPLNSWALEVRKLAEL